MTGELLGLALGVLAAVALVVLFAVVIPFWISQRRNREKGTHGFVQHSRLTCPKCQGVFDYGWIPGSALNAVRLGPKGRFMKCPLCHRWSVFDIWEAPVPPEGSPRESEG